MLGNVLPLVMGILGVGVTPPLSPTQPHPLPQTLFRLRVPLFTWGFLDCPHSPDPSQLPVPGYRHLLPWVIQTTPIHRTRRQVITPTVSLMGDILRPSPDGPV